VTVASVATMRAASLAAPGRIEIVETELPTPGPGEVRVRLEGSGVCASNLEAWAGQPWFQYPLESGAPGHEAWGRVDAVGDGVEDLRPGDRVALLSGRAYAEYDTAAATSVVRLPDSLADQPFPGEPLGCGVNIFRRSRIEAGQTVAIVGIGFLGALLCRLATDAGARVLAITRRPFALEIARSLGAAETIPMDDHWRIIERVRDLTDGVFCDRVIEATGKQWPLDLAGELTRERGMLVIAGYHQDGPRQVNMQLWNWRGLDVINAHERDPRAYLHGMHDAVAAVLDGRLPLDALLTHSYALEELGTALSLLHERPAGFMKATVSP
jgi:threonine dehydrogenase-like Zn-dependent dehydrogenase